MCNSTKIEDTAIESGSNIEQQKQPRRSKRASKQKEPTATVTSTKKKDPQPLLAQQQPTRRSQRRSKQKEPPATVTSTKKKARASQKKTPGKEAPRKEASNPFPKIDELSKMTAEDVSEKLPPYVNNDAFRELFDGQDLERIRMHVNQNSKHLVGVAVHDSYCQCPSHIRYVLGGNYPPSTKLDKVKKRLLWLASDGLPGEPCWRKVICTLINMHVNLYDWEYEAAKWFVMSTTAVINRTPVIMHGSIRDSREGKAAYEESVAETDELNKSMIQSVFDRHLTNTELSIFVFGKPAYESMAEFYRKIVEDRPDNRYFHQNGIFAHMLQYKAGWSTPQQNIALLCAYNDACARHNNTPPVNIALEFIPTIFEYRKMPPKKFEELMKEVNKRWNAQDGKAKATFQTKEELFIYLSQNNNDMVLVWLMEDLVKAKIDPKAELNPQLLKKLLCIQPLSKHSTKSNSDDSVLNMIGGDKNQICTINCKTLTALRGNKFAALQFEPDDKRFEYFDAIKVQTPTKRCPLPYVPVNASFVTTNTGRKAEGFVIRKKIRNVWKTILVSEGTSWTRSSYILDVEKNKVSKKKANKSMIVGNEKVAYLEVDRPETGRYGKARKVFGTYRVCKRTSAETGEVVIDADNLPCPEAYVHPSHVCDWTTDERKVKSNITELYKNIGNKAAWKECTNPQVRILYLHNLC